MKPLYIVGTERNVGKTTMSIGLLHALRKRNIRVGYVKPLGQRFAAKDGRLLHDDGLLVASCFGLKDVAQADVAVPLPSGRVEHEILNPNAADLSARACDAYAVLAKTNDLVVIEGMGHVAMGSCLGASAGDICRNVGAKALLVSGGGIGKAIDEIALCSTFIRDRGADLAGVVVNKVWVEKFDRVKKATTAGLEQLGIKSYGTVPFQQELASPTMGQVHDLVGGELLGGQEYLDHRVRHTIVAAMNAEHMLYYIKGQTLVIIPGDRSDGILASLRAHLMGDPNAPAVSGLILTGNFRPEERILGRIGTFHLPVIAVKEDTYTTASKIINAVFKIMPGDRERIEYAFSLISKHVDVDGILECLSK